MVDAGEGAGLHATGLARGGAGTQRGLPAAGPVRG
jgi:hypothetical protein